MTTFGPKRWTIPFGKISIFRLFKLLVFIAYKGFFFVVEYRKTRFLSYIAKRQKGEKMTTFGPKQWTNRFGKISIFRHFKVLCFLA